MDWAMEDYRQELRRIAAVLVALAVLAERLAGRPLAASGFVLWILHRAETVALEFVAANLPAAGAPRLAHPVGDRSAEAMRLALFFRALAAALTALSALVGGAGRPAGVSGRPPALNSCRSVAGDSRLVAGTGRLQDMTGEPINFPDTS